MVAAPGMFIPPRMTIEEWADMAEDEPGEFVNGYLEEEEVPNHAHEVVVSWTIGELRKWGKQRMALVFGSEHKFAVSPTRGRKPDVSMYAPGQRLARGSLSRTPPMLMVEVLTPTPRDVRRDRIEKSIEYAKFGVKYYWLIDWSTRVIECYELFTDGRVFRSATGAEGPLEVPGFEGLVLDLDDLWSEVDLVSDDPDESPQG